MDDATGIRGDRKNIIKSYKVQDPWKHTSWVDKVYEEVLSLLQPLLDYCVHIEYFNDDFQILWIESFYLTELTLSGSNKIWCFSLAIFTLCLI